MVGSGLLFMVTVLMAVLLVLMERLRFLIPYRAHLFHTYGFVIEICVLVLAMNLFALGFLLSRRFRLRDAGQKLLHLDKQVKGGQSDLSKEIEKKFHE